MKKITKILYHLPVHLSVCYISPFSKGVKGHIVGQTNQVLRAIAYASNKKAYIIQIYSRRTYILSFKLIINVIKFHTGPIKKVTRIPLSAVDSPRS